MAFCVFTINKITMRVHVFANIVNYNVIYSSVFSNTNYEYLGKKKFLLPETFPLIFFFIKVNIYILPWNYFITAGHCWSPRPLNHLYARSVGRFAHSLQSSSSLIESELTVLITWRPNRNKSYLLLFTPRCTPVELCAFCQRATSWSFFFFLVGAQVARIRRPISCASTQSLSKSADGPPEISVAPTRVFLSWSFGPLKYRCN